MAILATTSVNGPKTVAGESKPITVPDFLAAKSARRRLTMLTAYDATMARLLDRAGVDALLVGDSLGMVILGHDTTIPVTLDAMVHHARAVSRGAERAFVVADMPFLSWQASQADAIRNAGRLMQDGGLRDLDVIGEIPAEVKALVAFFGRVPEIAGQHHHIGDIFRVADNLADKIRAAV